MRGKIKGFKIKEILRHISYKRENLMQKFFLTSVLILLPLVSSAEVPLEGTMKCNIKDQQILEIKDGVSKRYTNYEGDLKVGDNLLLKYGLSKSNVFYLKSDRRFEDYPLSNFIIDLKFDTAKAVEVESYISTLKHLLEDDGFLSTQMTMSADEFEIGYVFGEGGLQFSRYYKSDWMGIFTYLSSSSSHSYTLDCKHITESVWSEVFLKLKKL
jgi:hypothetical protein